MVRIFRQSIVGNALKVFVDGRPVAVTRQRLYPNAAAVKLTTSATLLPGERAQILQTFNAVPVPLRNDLYRRP